MSTVDPSPDELRLLAALVRVCEQFMPGSSTYLDHGFLSSGENAVRVLSDYGLVMSDGAGGNWTARSQLFEKWRDDFSEAALEEFKRELRSVPDCELVRRQPGHRSPKPDVQIGHLRLWFISRATSKYDKRPELGRRAAPDRLDVEARLSPVLALSSVTGELLTIPQLKEFRQQLILMHDSSAGTADLVAYKESLEVQLEAGADGVVGSITLRHPNFGTSLQPNYVSSN